MHTTPMICFMLSGRPVNLKEREEAREFIMSALYVHLDRRTILRLAGFFD
jgi:hypothetical protein